MAAAAICANAHGTIRQPAAVSAGLRGASASHILTCDTKLPTCNGIQCCLHASDISYHAAGKSTNHGLGHIMPNANKTKATTVRIVAPTTAVPAVTLGTYHDSAVRSTDAERSAACVAVTGLKSGLLPRPGSWRAQHPVCLWPAASQRQPKGSQEPAPHPRKLHTTTLQPYNAVIRTRWPCAGNASSSACLV
jgi:hypothetical protein